MKISLSERTAAVEYDPAIVAASDIAKAVSDIGYIAQQEIKRENFKTLSL